MSWQTRGDESTPIWVEDGIGTNPSATPPGQDAETLFKNAGALQYNGGPIPAGAVFASNYATGMLGAAPGAFGGGPAVGSYYFPSMDAARAKFPNFGKVTDSGGGLSGLFDALKNDFAPGGIPLALGVLGGGAMGGGLASALGSSAGLDALSTQAAQGLAGSGELSNIPALTEAAGGAATGAGAAGGTLLASAPAATVTDVTAGLGGGEFAGGAEGAIGGAGGGATAVGADGLATSLGGVAATGAAAGAAGGAAGTAASTAISRILNGSATAADYASVLGSVAPAALGAFASSQQSDAIKALSDQARSDRAPFLNAATGWLADPSSFTNGPGQSSLQAVLRGLSVNGNPANNPTSLGIATDASLKNWQNAVTGFGNIGLSGQDSRTQLGLAGVNADANVWNSVGSGAANLLNPPKSLADIYKSITSGTGLV